MPGTRDFIRTRNHRKFFPLDPVIEHIDIRDMAWSLANESRFSGFTSRRYSVAEHCILVCDLCPPEHKLRAMLHEGSEGLGLRDMARPIKYSIGMESYLKAEKRLQACVYERFGLDNEECPALKRADDIALGIEAVAFMGVTKNDCEGFEYYVDLLDSLTDAEDRVCRDWVEFSKTEPGSHTEIYRWFLNKFSLVANRHEKPFNGTAVHIY